MIQRIKNFAASLMMLLTIGAPAALVPATTYAAAGTCNTISGGIAKGATDASGDTTDCSATDVGGESLIGHTARSVVNIFSIVVGAVAILMIIYGGFRYITSGGDSGRVGNAKNTLIYAIIGLVIVALAQIIVKFVLNTTSNVS